MTENRTENEHVTQTEETAVEQALEIAREVQLEPIASSPPIAMAFRLDDPIAATSIRLRILDVPPPSWLKGEPDPHWYRYQLGRGTLAGGSSSAYGCLGEALEALLGGPRDGDR